MDDLKFVRRCINADKRSWDEFVDKYSRLIYSYIYSVLKIKANTLSQENISDLFQNIFLLLTRDNFKKLRSFRAKNGCSLASWLRQVTINHTIDYIRRLKPNISLDEERGDDFSIKEILPDVSNSVIDMLDKEETIAHLNDCIEGLEKDDRYFLELYINRDLTLEELRRHLKISRGAVDMRKVRIIERLKDCFRAKGIPLA